MILANLKEAYIENDLTVNGNIINNPDALLTDSKNILGAINEVKTEKANYVSTQIPYTEDWTLAQLVEWIASFPGMCTIGRIRIPNDLSPGGRVGWYRCFMALQNAPYGDYSVVGAIIFMDGDNVFYGHIAGTSEFTLTWYKLIRYSDLEGNMSNITFDCASAQRTIVFKNIGPDKIGVQLASGTPTGSADFLLWDSTRKTSIWSYDNNDFSFTFFSRVFLRGYAYMPTVVTSWLTARDSTNMLVFGTGTNTAGIYPTIRIQTQNGSWIIGTIAEDLWIGYVLNSRTSSGADVAFRHHSNGDFRISGNLYAKTSTVSVSDERDKKEISDLDADYSEQFIMKLNPVSYKFISGTSDRTHYGLVAQDVEMVLGELGKTTQDFGGVVIDDDKTYGLRYEEFLAPLIKLSLIHI